MNTLVGRYKKYKMFAPGGSLGSADAGMGFNPYGMGASMIGQVASALNTPNQYGRGSMAGDILTNAGSMASLGAVGGPWGMAAGAVVGAGMGILQAEKQKRVETQMVEEQNRAWLNQNRDMTRSRVGADPNLVYGDLGASYYATGGRISKFHTGEKVGWNSEAGHVSGTITAVHRHPFKTYGKDGTAYTRHASPDNPQYSIKSGKSDHIANHFEQALHRLSADGLLKYPNGGLVPGVPAPSIGADSDATQVGHSSALMNSYLHQVGPNGMIQESLPAVTITGQDRFSGIPGISEDRKNTARAIQQQQGTDAAYNYLQAKAGEDFDTYTSKGLLTAAELAGSIPELSSAIAEEGMTGVRKYLMDEYTPTGYLKAIPRQGDAALMRELKYRPSRMEDGSIEDIEKDLTQEDLNKMGNRYLTGMKRDIEPLEESTKRQRAYGGSVDEADPQNQALQKTLGGDAKALSRQSAEFTGPDHEQGGIDLPGEGAQVEGGETASGDYVFSKRLGFAQAHKPIAKAMGKIEQKPDTPLRNNSLNFLKRKEQMLALSQEYLKQKLGLN